MAETHNPKILIVDDEAELKNALVEALSAQSFDVRGFCNPHEALAALAQEPFDVVLSDLMMPEMDGIALVERALEIDPHLVPIIMTGQGAIQTAVDAMKVGAFDYVLKPFRLATLLPTLTRAINARRLRLENMQLRETVAIYELCQTIAFTLDQQTLISKLADAALQQTEADEVSILLPTNEGEELYVAAVRGAGRQRLLGERVALDESISGWVVRERQPLLLNGEVDDSRFHALWPHPEIKSSISIPMQVGSRLIGTIHINDVNRPRPFTLGQLKALTILASTAAAALESASLYEQVEKERKRLDDIVSTVPGVVWEAWGQPDKAGQRINFVSDYVETMLGYTVEEWLSTPNFWLQIVHPDDRERAAGAAAAAFANCKLTDSMEFRWVKRDGTALWVESTYSVITDEHGQPIGMRGVNTDISERKRAEAALRESEERYKGLSDSAFDGIVIHRDGKILSLNRAYAEMFGYTAGELIGEEILKLTPDSHRDFVSEQITQARNIYEAIGLKKDGTLVNIEVSSQTCTYQGVPARMAAVRDITQRKRAEEALRTSEERYRNLVENARDIIYSHDLEGNYTSANRAGERITGYNLQESLKLNLSETLVPEDVERAREMMARKLAGEEITAYELEILAKDGRRVPLEVNTWLQIENGVTVGIQGIGRDVSERRAAERALANSEKRTSMVLDAVTEGVHGLDLHGNVIFENASAAAMFGRTAEEMVGKHAHALMHHHRADGSVYPVEDCPIYQTLRDGRNRRVEGEVFFRRDGSDFPVEYSCSPSKNEKGEVTGVVVSFRDVTDRKQLEEQLRQSQKMEAIGRLAGGVAHDFNNLLTAINGYTALALRRSDERSSIKPYLEEVQKAGERATNLTRQLLAFGRKQILQPVSLDLNNIVSDMNKMLRRLIGEDIMLTAKLASSLRTIKADPGQIEQVLVNLVVNARDAMPSGGNLTIETANIDLEGEYARTHVGVSPGHYVMLAVSDTGTGMTEEVRAQIFEPFFTTKEQGKGTGLGLSTVYGIVQQSGGSIWVYSEPNHGTSFKVYLPQGEVLTKTEERKSADEEMARGSETVLLVEDEEVVRGLAAHILEDAGYRVLKAHRGDEAIRLCAQESEHIDLLLTDVVMPEKSGKEVADRVTAMRPHLKVLFMSGYTDEAIVNHGVLESGIEFIQKPFTPLALSKKVREVLDSNGLVR